MTLRDLIDIVLEKVETTEDLSSIFDFEIILREGRPPAWCDCKVVKARLEHQARQLILEDFA